MTGQGWLGLGFILALVAAIATASVQGARYKRAQTKVDAHEACVRVVKGPPGFTSATCDPAIAQADERADRAVACDEALAGANAYGVGASCSTPVKTVVAQRDAADRRVLGLQAQLSTLRSDQSAAIARAEARARTQAERKAHAQDVVRRAPRDGDGLTVCDADCMRDRWGPETSAVRQP